ncbi:MAG: hypothetical protein ACYSU0_20095, partial [Planctomycetota bacterium]
HALRKDGFDGAIDLVLADRPRGLELTGARIPAGCNRLVMTLTAPRRTSDELIRLRLFGRSRIGKVTATRPALPSEDVMQAFLWRHLAPSRELVMLVRKSKWAPPPVRRLGETPLRIPARGEVEVRYTGLRRKDQKLDLTLLDAPAGVTIHDVRVVAGGVAFTLKSDGEKVKAGTAGNLVFEAFVELPPRAKADGDKKKAKKPNRYSLGVWPAVPFVVGGKG